jgi:hypothetical protein
MSKKNERKNNQAKKAEPSKSTEQTGTPAKRYLTDEEKAWIIKERLARRPVIVFRYRNGQWNWRLIVMLLIMAAALVASLFFLTRY